MKRKAAAISRNHPPGIFQEKTEKQDDSCNGPAEKSKATDLTPHCPPDSGVPQCPSFLSSVSLHALPGHLTHGLNLHPSSDDLVRGIPLPSTHLHLCVTKHSSNNSASGREPTTPHRSEWHHPPPIHLVTNQARRPEAIPGLPPPHSHIQSFRVL